MPNLAQVDSQIRALPSAPFRKRALITTFFIVAHGSLLLLRGSGHDIRMVLLLFGSELANGR